MKDTLSEYIARREKTRLLTGLCADVQLELLRTGESEGSDGAIDRENDVRRSVESSNIEGY